MQSAAAHLQVLLACLFALEYALHLRDDVVHERRVGDNGHVNKQHAARWTVRVQRLLQLYCMLHVQA